MIISLGVRFIWNLVFRCNFKRKFNRGMRITISFNAINSNTLFHAALGHYVQIGLVHAAQFFFLLLSIVTYYFVTTGVGLWGQESRSAPAPGWMVSSICYVTVSPLHSTKGDQYVIIKGNFHIWCFFMADITSLSTTVSMDTNITWYTKMQHLFLF